MFFSSLPHRDIANSCGDQYPFRIFQRAQHDLDGELASILTPRGKLDARADLLCKCLRRGPRTVRDQPFCEPLRNDARYLLPYQLVAGVSELSLCLNIQQNNLSALVHHHHRIRSRLQQAPVSAFHLHQMFFSRLPHRNITNGCGDKYPFRIFQRAQHDLNGKLASILTPPGEFDTRTYLLH